MATRHGVARVLGQAANAWERERGQSILSWAEFVEQHADRIDPFNGVDELCLAEIHSWARYAATEIASNTLVLRMEDADGERLVEYARDDWSQLQLAYAITSHRAQGSEWPNVVIVLSQSHYMMLQRNLLYTALTRARMRAVIIVSGGLQNKQTGQIYKTALEVAIANDRIARRYSGLAERLGSFVQTQ